MRLKGSNSGRSGATERPPREGLAEMNNPGPTMAWRAKNAIEQWLRAVDLQHERANAPFPAALAGAVAGQSVSAVALESEVYKRQVDIELYLVALRRLRRAAEFAVRYVPGGRALNAASRDFDRCVPYAITLRNVTEHFDDYQVGRGKARRPGEVGFVTVYTLDNTSDGKPGDGAGFVWGNRAVKCSDATPAARTLHDRVQEFLRPLL